MAIDSLWAALCNSAARWPQRVAIARGDACVTFEQWQRRSLDYASVLCDAKVDRGERVVLWMEPSTELAAAVFGCWAAGCVPTLIDPRSRGAGLRAAIDTAQPAAALCDDALPGLETAGLEQLQTSGIVAVTSPVEPREPGSGAEPASVVFTSGSTGGPKGVTQTHENLALGCRTVSDYLGIDVADTLLCPVPWSFDYGFVQLQTTALTGATQVLPDGPTPNDICSAIERYRPTVLAGVPSLYAYLLQRISRFRDIDRACIRTFMNTGGSIPADHLDELLALMPNARCFLNYGLTESYRTSYLDPDEVHRRPRSIGKAIDGVEVAIVRDDGSEAATDEIGEIVHRGALIFSHYWGDVAATDAVRRADPLDPGAGPALFTGDRGRVDADGFLHFEGRRDRLIKSMGVRVNPAEIEEILSASRRIAQVAVFGIPNELSGQEICAAVVPNESADASDSRKALLRYARAEMSPHMLPRRIRIVSEIPQTRSGKTDYPALIRDAIADG